MAVPNLPEFNIPNVSRDSDHKNLMKNVRPNLGVKISSYQLPVLTPSPPSTAAGDKLIKFFDMVLRADTNEAITLRLRQDNLYLVGFRMERSGVWWEFTIERTRLIPGSSDLGFGGGYDAMIAASGGGGDIEDRSFGKVLLTDAVIQLNNSNTNRATRARTLIVVIVMICESLRFTYISDFLAETFNANNRTKQPNARMVALMKNWGKLSELLLKREQDPTHYFPSNPPPKEMEIHNYLDAVAVLGVLKEVKVTSTTALLTTTSVVTTDEQQQYPYPLGEPMVEVISVTIDHTLLSNMVYGTIQVIDGTGSQYIYNKTTPNVKIKPTDFLLLASPDRSILAYDSFTINVNLKEDGNNNNTPTNTSSPKTPKDEDDDVINGMISWNAFHTTTNVYDQPLREVIKGEYGSSVTVNYAVLSDAVKANLEVTLLKLDGDDDGTGTDTTAAPVYGDLIAHIGNFEEGIVLFKKASEEDHICVTPGKPIPLLRSFVAVPLNSSLIVQADISSLDDHDIAKGTAEFPTLLSGTSEKTISGKYGEIQVKVTWERET